VTVHVDEKRIKDSRKEYKEKLMNKKNEWDHKIDWLQLKKDQQITSGLMKLLQH